MSRGPLASTRDAEPMDWGATRSEACARHPSPIPDIRSPLDLEERLGDRYTAIAVLGRGSMGTVYRAYDRSVRREVAIKVLRGGTADAQAQLVEEARTMARLSSPHVVPVYDVEIVREHADRNRVLLVMQYVRGQTLQQWLVVPRSTKEILDTFVQAGRGLWAAHRHGIVHRDFKPANVLVAEDGRVLVTDFGLAGAWDEANTATGADDEATFARGRVRGSPWYMPLEQHLGLGVDPRADQYAFCVALWEALTDLPLFGDATSPATLVERKQGPLPPWPKSCDVPRRIVQALHRGLQQRSEERFPSMVELLEALRSSSRSRLLPGVTLASAGILMTAYGWSSHVERSQTCTGADEHLRGIWDATRSEAVAKAMLAIDLPYAASTHAHVREQLDAYARSWVEDHRSTCEATALHGTQTPEAMDMRMACLHQARVGMQSLVDVFIAADAAVVERAASTVARLPSLQRCRDIDALASGGGPPTDPETAAIVAKARKELTAASVLAHTKPDAALERLQAAEMLLADVDHPPVSAELDIVRGAVLEGRGDHRGAEAILTAGLTAALGLGSHDSSRRAVEQLTGVVGNAQRRHAEGLRLARLAVSLSSAAAEKNEVALTGPLELLAQMLLWSGRDDEARQHMERSLALRLTKLAPSAPEVGQAYNTLANIAIMQGRYDEAREHQRRALEVYDDSLGEAHPLTLKTRANAAILLREQGQYAASAAELREVAMLMEQSLGPDHPDVAMMIDLHGTSLGHAGDLANAEAEHRKAIERFSLSLGPTHVRVAKARDNLANILTARGEHEAALVERRQALAILEAIVGQDHWDVALLRSHMIADRSALGDVAGAEVEARRTLEAFERVLGPEHGDVADAARVLGEILVIRSKRDEAREHLERAWSIVEKVTALPSNRAKVAFALAKLVWPSEPVRAVELARTAQRELDQVAQRIPETVRELDSWLAAHATR